MFKSDSRWQGIISHCKCFTWGGERIMNYSHDRSVWLPVNLGWHSTLLKKLDWNVCRLIYLPPPPPPPHSLLESMNAKQHHISEWPPLHPQPPHPADAWWNMITCGPGSREKSFFTWTSVTVSCRALVKSWRPALARKKCFPCWPRILLN